MSVRSIVPRRPLHSDWLAQTRRWKDAVGVHIDVRGLAAPGPLVAIMQLIASVSGPATVIVHHDRDPILLYPELAERGWSAERIEAAALDPGEVRLKLQRAR